MSELSKEIASVEDFENCLLFNDPVPISWAVWKYRAQKELIDQQAAEITRLAAIEQALIDFHNDMVKGHSDQIEDLYNWLHSTTGYKGDEQS